MRGCLSVYDIVYWSYVRMHIDPYIHPYKIQCNHTLLALYSTEYVVAGDEADGEMRPDRTGQPACMCFGLLEDSTCVRSQV